MHSRLMSWSRILYLAGIVLALVLVIPTAWFPFQLAKIAIFALVLAAVAILFVVGGGAKELLRTHGLYLALLVGVLPLAYLFSVFFSTDPSLAFSGTGIETDTIAFVTLASIAFLLSFALFRTLRMVRLLTTVVFWTLAAAAIFQAIVIIFGTSLVPFQIFSDRSVNLIGKWNDLGITASLLAIFLLVQAEMGHAAGMRRIIIGVSLAALAILLGIINFTLAWSFVLVAALSIGVIKVLGMRKAQAAEASTPTGIMHMVPWYAAIGAFVAVLFILFGSAFNTGLTKITPVSSLEVRPSFSSTLDVVAAARGTSLGRAIVGTGPNTFGESWIMHKPAEVNQSLFWNLDFNVGFSTLVTAFGTVGLIGILAWLTPLFLVSLAIIRVWRLAVLSREEKVAGTGLALAALALFASILLYVPSSNLIFLAFILSGATFGFLWRQGQAGQTEVAEASGMKKIGSMIVMAAILVLAVLISFVADRRFIAELLTQRAQYALGQGQTENGVALIANAQGVEKDRNNMRLAVDAGNLKLQQLAADKTTPAADLQTKFAAELTRTIDAGKAAIAMYPTDYQQFLSFGRVYDFLTSLKIQGAYDSAKQAYTEAQKLNPNDPEIALALGRLEASQGNTQASSDAITRALTLKPNYTDAILFVVQLSVANNDLATAIRAATAATQTAPGVGPIWFELGLLYYAGGDTKSAIAPLEKSISIVPDYANAKYFLGLSYYAQKMSLEAKNQFDDLAKSNPDNAEIKLILANIDAGNPPFQAAQPPVSTPPTKRTTAPLP